MKVKRDEELTEKEKEIFGIAEEIAEKYFYILNKKIEQVFPTLGKLDQSQAASFLGKIYTLIICNGIKSMKYVVDQFPDHDITTDSLYKEFVEGCGIILGIKKYDPKCYNNEIKKLDAL